MASWNSASASSDRLGLDAKVAGRLMRQGGGSLLGLLEILPGLDA